MNALEWIKLHGYTGARVVLDKLPKNVTHMTDDGRMFVNAKAPCLFDDIKPQIDNLVCISDLKKFTYSLELIKDLDGLYKAIYALWRAEFNEFLTISYFKNGEEWTVRRLRVQTAIEDYLLIHGEPNE